MAGGGKCGGFGGFHVSSFFFLAFLGAEVVISSTVFGWRGCDGVI